MRNQRRPISRSGRRTVDSPRGSAGRRDIVGAGHRDGLRDRIPSSARRPSAPSASRSLAQQTALKASRRPASSRPRGRRRSRRSSFAPPAAPRTRCRPPRDPAGSPPAPPRRRTAPAGRPGTRSGGGRARPGHRPSQRPLGVSTPTSGSPSACGAVDVRRAVGAHGRQVPFVPLSDPGSSRPLPSNTTAAAGSTAAGRRRALPLGIALGAAGDEQEAGSRGRVLYASTTSAKYRSLMSWTMTAATGTRLLSSPRASAFGT